MWDGKPDKIKRAYLYNEYEFGGQKLLNIKTDQTFVGKMTCVMHKVDVLTDLPKL